MRLRRFSSLSFRNLGARPQRTILTAVGIVLGVGIVFGVVTLSSTMQNAFGDLFSRAYGAADVTVTAAGGSGAFDEGIVGDVRAVEGVATAAPRLSLSASLLLEGEGEQGLPNVQSLRLFGVEPATAALATGFDLEEGRFPREGSELTLDGATAEAAGLAVGDTVDVGTPGGPVEAELVGLLRIPGGSFGGVGFGMAPLPFAQEEFEEPGGVSGISVAAADGTPAEELRASLNETLGEGLEAELSATRTEQINQQFQSFGIALLFFAGTALFVGAFLVFNALSMTVLERTRELGMLRALGSTRSMISGSVVIEAALLGLVGSAAGLLFGYGIARGLLYLFGRTFGFGTSDLSFSPFALVASVAVGVAVTVLAALYPAVRAGRVSPVEAMRARSGASARSRRSRVFSVLTPVLGLVLIGVGAPWVYYLARNLSAQLDGLLYFSGIAGVVATFLGVSLVIPTLVRPLAALFSPLLRLLFGLEGRMAAANATRNRTRTALTASALMVGISLVVAFAALGGSVLGSIRASLEGSLGSDYVVQPANQNAPADFSDDLPERVGEVSGIEETTALTSTFRRSGEEVSIVFGVDEGYPEIFTLNYAPGTPEDAYARLQEGEALIGEQLAGSRELEVGSSLELPTPGGEREYRVAGIVENDPLGGGTGIYLSREVLARDFNEDNGQFLAVKAAPDADFGALEEEISGILQDYPQFALYSNAEWNAQIERDFNRQYVFFYAIMGVSVAVSAFGVVNTLSMSVFERTREIGVLRAVGTTRLQVGRLIVDEGVVISFIGCLVGIVVGSLLGYLFVLGSGAGGFEVEFFYPTLPAVAALVGGLAIGVFAGLLPARSAAKTNIVEAVQYE